MCESVTEKHYMDSADLDKLCKDELKLNFVKAVKFKSLVRELKLKYVDNVCFSEDDAKQNEVSKELNVEKIALRIHSNRKHYADNSGSWAASNLLGDSYYCSAINRDFKEGECDWVIFEWVQLYLPTKVIIKQHGIYPSNLKTMSLWMGNGEEWLPLTPSFINVGQCKDRQTFVINGVDQAIIKKKLLNRIKFELVQNWGNRLEAHCRFYLQDFEVHGVKL